MTLLWLVSVLLKNVSIVDLFWGFGFVLSAGVYAFYSVDIGTRGFLVLVLVTIWGIRLSGYLTWRNSGKGEDFRYREFRRQYGEKRYWWISYFQTFLLQGVLMWLISAPLLGAIKGHGGDEISMIDFIGLALWIIGFVFETGGDWQLAKFKSNPANRGSVLNSGFWRYTRHPNYFGDAAVWWGFGLFSISSGNYLPALGSLLMTALIIKVSGVYLLEKTLKTDKPGYASYIRQTSAFIPWFPKKLRS
jgi:steroid 5-alpha reductase family enzyme